MLEKKRRITSRKNVRKKRRILLGKMLKKNRRIISRKNIREKEENNFNSLAEGPSESIKEKYKGRRFSGLYMRFM